MELCMEGIVKVSKILVVVSLLCLGLLVFLMPALNVVAQDSTATPLQVIITATPSSATQAPEGTADANAALNATADASGNSPDTPPYIQAVRAAGAIYAKQLGTTYLWIKQHMVMSNGY